MKGSELISKLYSTHHEGNKNMGFDIEVCKCNENTFTKILLMLTLCVNYSLLDRKWSQIRRPASEMMIIMTDVSIKSN